MTKGFKRLLAVLLTLVICLAGVAGLSAQAEETTTKLVPKQVETPVAGTAYKLYLTQAKLEKTLYFTGEMSGYYFAVSEDAAEAVDVYLEAVEGGYQLSFTKDEVKQYVDIYVYNDAGAVGVRITAEPTAVYTYDTEIGSLVANIAGTDYYLGTYASNARIGASKTSYITETNLGVEQFPVAFGTLVEEEVTETPEETPEEPEVVALPFVTPKEGVAYQLALYQSNLDGGKTLYFAGEMDGKYLAATDNIAEAVNVHVEEVADVEGGWRLYFNQNGVKTYIDVETYTNSKGNLAASVKLTTTPSVAVFVYDAELKTMVTTLSDKDWYLGTYNTYKTISASDTYYITGDNAAMVGVSQFVSGFLASEQSDYELSFETPVAGTAYNLALYQNNWGKVLYFAGEKDGNFLATTEVEDEATNVYVEEVEGGYRLYFNKGGEKQYIDVETYTNKNGRLSASVKITETPTAVFTYDAELKTMVTRLEDNDWYLGTYNSFLTISSSNLSYISGDNASKIGITQYPAGFLASDNEEKVEVPEEPVYVTTLESGTYVIWAPGHNKALSINKSEEGGYYNGGVDVVWADENLSGYTNAEIWTVTKNEDGTYTISCEEGVFSMSTYSSTGYNQENDTWVLEDAGDGSYYVKNVNRDRYLGWSTQYGNWTTKAAIGSGNEGDYAVKFTPAVAQVEPELPDSPDSGDHSQMILWGAAMVCSAVAVVAIVLKKRNKKA